MCGITGFVGEGHETDLIKMRDAMSHRGPDDKGIYLNHGVGLAHRRLSVIDLENGKQPMQNQDGTIQVICNGEIYNYRELRTELTHNGYKFRTDSDTEVIVYAYEEWGADFLIHLRGMFAIAVWDQKKQKLLLSRDRMGIKPVYYAQIDGGLIFASEIKALLNYPKIDKEIDKQALDVFLRSQYVPSPMTIFKKIRKLPPAHHLIFKDGEVCIDRYWSPIREEIVRSEDEWLDCLEENLLDAVKSHLVSDVPLGAFLSGGIDSSAIVMAMHRLGVKSIKTFTIGFEDAKFDERRYANSIADICGTEHQEEIVSNALDEAMIDKLIYQLDEPMSDTSFFPTYLISRLAKRNVTVSLSGDGGDETFLGYDRYQHWNNWMNRWSTFEKTPFIKTLSQLVSKTQLPLGRRTFNALSKDAVGAYAELFYSYYSKKTDYLYGDQFRNQANQDPWKQLNIDSFTDVLNLAQQADYQTYLPEDILMKVDKMSMLNSLEVRVPFLDHKFQEFACSIPNSLKINSGKGKYILRLLLERWGAPPELMERKKVGFSPSMNYWFSNSFLNQISQDLLEGVALSRGIFSQKGISKVLKTKDKVLLWNVWFFERWARQFL